MCVHFISRLSLSFSLEFPSQGLDVAMKLGTLALFLEKLEQRMCHTYA